MTDEMQPPDDLGAIENALRGDLHGTFVPFDEARADEMIEAATRTQVRRLPRLAAPLGTAAAVLAVGAGAAVFAANGTGDNAAPAGGHPRHHPAASVLCAHALATLPQRVLRAPVPNRSATAIPGLRPHRSPGTRISAHLARSAGASAAPKAKSVRVGPYQSTLRCSAIRSSIRKGTRSGEGIAVCAGDHPLPRRLLPTGLPRQVMCQMLPDSTVVRVHPAPRGSVPISVRPSPYRVHVPMPRTLTASATPSPPGS